MQDYYAILGLDPDASPESIKIAYRRLARLHHPDVHATANDKDKASVEARMAKLNEAYAVLSRGRSRREYDEKLHLETTLAAKSATTTVLVDTQTGTSQSKTTGSRVSRTRTASHEEVDATVITQFSAHFRENLLNRAAGFSWKKIQFEGFDWALEASSWASHYCVAMRGFAAMDLAVAKRFINYAETVTARYRRQIRRNSFLFLVPFVRISEWEGVSGQCQPFATRRNGTGIVLLDIPHGRALRFGAPMADKKFEKIIQSIRTAR